MVEGIKRTVERCIETGVLIESASYFNIFILPGCDIKLKWCLVHDVRAVDKVLEDWPTGGPNPYVLLLTVFPADNCFTVIDVCSAFSVSL